MWHHMFDHGDVGIVYRDDSWFVEGDGTLGGWYPRGRYRRDTWVYPHGYTQAMFDDMDMENIHILVGL